MTDDAEPARVVPKRSVSKPPHPADGLTVGVDCGGGATMTIADPRSYEDGGISWQMTWGNPEPLRYVVASVLGSYDYLLSGSITMAEATRRLRLLVREWLLTPCATTRR